MISGHLRTACQRRLQSSALGRQVVRSIVGTSNKVPTPPVTDRHKQYHSRPTVSSEALQTTKSSHKLAHFQQECWDAYLSTGRGCLTLFQLIDANHSGTINVAELQYFIKNTDCRGLNQAAIKEIQDITWDHNITFPEFQEWLIRATKFDESHGDARYQAMYDFHPNLGQRDETRKDSYTWNSSTMSQGLRRMQYAVRGEVVMKADAMAAEGKEIIYTNIGNPHAVGQHPITFYREVMALCDLPPEYGVENPAIADTFPADVIERAREMRAAMPSGTGAYTNSQGILEFRQHIADYITDRDEHIAYPANIFLTNGASAGIEMVLNGLISDDKDAIMIPIPQYPIYSALIGRLGARQIGYYLDENIGWAVSEEELQNRLDEANEMGLNTKALAMINPGNPTGQVLKREDLEVICKFCAKNGIVLLADEVYQRNVYTDEKEFISAKKIAMETPGCEDLQLVSFHSTSKGFIGECGRRGGWMELHHIDPYVQTQLYKLASSGLCSGVPGQIMSSLMIKPPLPGGESYDKFMKEEGEIYESLKKRAKILVDGLNSIDGIECVQAEGAMYAFPRITNLPEKALLAAKANDQSPDTLYALSLLEETGICVVPASGFGQAPGRVGFRTTFLPPEDKVIKAVEEFKRHHELFCKKYS